MADVVEFVSVAVAAAVVTVATQVLLLWLHEGAHWLVAVLVGLRVVDVEVGRGPAWRVWWLGGVPLTIRRWPLVGGRVAVLYPERWLRTRMLPFVLAGPATNVAAAVGMHLLVLWSIDRPRAVCFLAIAAFVVAALRALLALVPLPMWTARGTAHDLVAAVGYLRMPAAERAELSATAASERPKVDFWHAFLRGDLGRAEVWLHVLRSSDRAAPTWASLAALLRLVRDDPEGAWIEHERSEELAAASRPAQEPTPAPAVDAAPSDAELDAHELAVNRVFFLAHLGGTEHLAEADRLSATWAAPLAGTAAALRTRGLVLLHRGELPAAITTLHRAVAEPEPFWLRALGMAWLAHAYAEAGNARAARRWVRAARRLHPQSLLLPARLRLVDAALTTARPARAAAQPIR